jgi:hypothetical protein
MLPAHRMSVGGVTLAILISVLAFAGATIAPTNGDVPEFTGSIGAAFARGSIPIDIGEASSTELPVTPTEDIPPVITVPHSRPPHESRIGR